LGNTVIDKDITIKGALVVEGETLTNVLRTTITHDNLILSRSGAVNYPTTESGFIINKQTSDSGTSNVVGLVFDPYSNKMSICSGLLDTENKLTNTKSSPLVTTKGTIKSDDVVIFDLDADDTICVKDSGININSLINDINSVKGQLTSIINDNSELDK
jgi:hypothetical protein